MIKRCLLFISINIIVIGSVFSQEKKDIGFQLGASYYIGDYNQGKPLYQPLPAVGFIFRYNLSKFYAFRLSASYGGLRGNYNSFNQFLPIAPSSFTKQIIETELLSEVNFLSFSTLSSKGDTFAPYVIFGIGGAYSGGEIIPNIPFGVGFKYCPIPRITIGCEWRLHKTFTDKIDNYQNIFDGSKAIFHNNDWFSFVGLFITYRLYNSDITCPAYK